MGAFLTIDEMNDSLLSIRSGYFDGPGGYVAFVIDNPWAHSNDKLAELIFPSWDSSTFKTNNNAKKRLADRGMNQEKIEHWKPRKGKDNSHIIKGFVRFLVDNYLRIDLDGASGESFLSFFNNHDLKKNESEEWMNRYETMIDYNLSPPYYSRSEYTKYSHCLFNYYPGRDWFISKYIDPLMFNSAIRRADINERRLVSVIEKIYLFHSDDVCNEVGRPREHQDFITEAKIMLVNNPKNFTRSMITKYISRKAFDKIPGGWESLVAKLVTQFNTDLEYGGKSHSISSFEGWSTNKFYERVDKSKYERCMLSRERFPDLHHLLSRKDYPQYVFEPTNIVPLSYGLHMFIHRECLTGKFEGVFKKPYEDLCNEWERKFKKGQDVSKLFLPILLKIREEYMKESSEEIG